MGKYNIRMDGCFKARVSDLKGTNDLKYGNIISKLPEDIITKLGDMSFDESKKLINCIYNDYKSKSNPDEKKNTVFSIRCDNSSDNRIRQLMGKWNVKNKSDVIKILLAVAILYYTYKNEFYKKLGISSENPSSFPYVCYQMGNKHKLRFEIEKVLKQIPSSINTVVEPFMGMCGLTLNVLQTLSDRSLDYYAYDSDYNLINLYHCIKTNSEKTEKVCGKLIDELKSGNENFETVKEKRKNRTKTYLNYKASAEHMYLDAVSVRHKTENLNKKYSIADLQIAKFSEYVNNVSKMAVFLNIISVSKRNALNVLKDTHRSEKTLFLLDPPYLDSSGYKRESNTVEEFTQEDYDKMVNFCKKIPDDSIFMLFGRFTKTRTRLKGEKDSDIKTKETNGCFLIDDYQLRGYYNLMFGLKSGNKKYYYKEILFDGRGTIEFIISNYPFDDFILF